MNPGDIEDYCTSTRASQGSATWLGHERGQPPAGRCRKYCEDCAAGLRHRTPTTQARKMARKMRKAA